MKQKKLEKNLSLKKETITNLISGEMLDAKGGTFDTQLTQDGGYSCDPTCWPSFALPCTPHPATYAC